MGGSERGRGTARLGTTLAPHAASGSGSSARKRWVLVPTLPERWEWWAGCVFGREAGCGEGREVRKAARFARPSTSGLTLSKHPFGTTLVPRVVPNITVLMAAWTDSELWPAMPITHLLLHWQLEGRLVVRGTVFECRLSAAATIPDWLRLAYAGSNLEQRRVWR